MKKCLLLLISYHLTHDLPCTYNFDSIHRAWFRKNYAIKMIFDGNKQLWMFPNWINYWRFRVKLKKSEIEIKDIWASLIAFILGIITAKLT